MELLAFTLKEDFRELSGMTERNFAPVFKKALQGILKSWQVNFLQRHFQKSAKTRYPEVYQGYKKTEGFPLVNTGNLRSHVLNASNGRIHGTSNGAKIDILYGAPARFRSRTVFQKIDEYMRDNPKVRRLDAWRTVLAQMQDQQEKTLARRVIYYMKKRNMTKAQAQKLVYGGVGYPDQLKEMFQEMLAYVSEVEERDLAKQAWEMIEADMSKRAKKRTVKVQ